MAHLDLFTQKRLEHAVRTFRNKEGQLPTRKDLNEQGFSDDMIRLGIKDKVIEEFYVTLSNGSIVKGYKVYSGDPF